MPLAIPADATHGDLCVAIRALRELQRTSSLTAERAELQVEIDVCLDLLNRVG